jgi:hypothetical protein
MLARFRERHGEPIRQHRVTPVGGDLGNLDTAISKLELIRAVVANFGLLNLLSDLAPFTDLVMRRLTSLQVVVLGVQSPFYLPDMPSTWTIFVQGRCRHGCTCNRVARAPTRHFAVPSASTA